MWTLILVAVILVIIIHFIFSFHKDQLPGPIGLPILGHLLYLDPKYPHKSLTEMSRKYGRKYGLFGIKLGRVRTVVISDPKLIRQALAKDEFSGRAPLYLTHGIMQGLGLICSEGELWRQQRKFATSCLKSLGMVRIGERRHVLAEKLQDSAKEFLTILSDRVSQDPLASVNPIPPLLHTLGNAMNSIVFGREYKIDDPKWCWLQHLQEEGVKRIGVAGPLNFLPWLRFIPHYRRSMEFLLDGKNKTHDIYREILREHAAAGTTQGHVAGAYLTEMALRSPDTEGSFTESQCMHVLADLFGAGVDTTFATLRWLLVFMAAHPSVQQRVQAELDAAVFARSGTSLQLSDALLCPYAEAVIAETQRIRPVVPLGIPHGALQDCELAGFSISRGTMIVPLQWAVHTDPEIWGPDSYEFHPERFLNSEGRLIRPDAFIPFQTGKRVCLGVELARMLLFVFGMSVTHKFTMTMADNTDLADVLEGDCGITHNPKPFRLILTPRN